MNPTDPKDKDQTAENGEERGEFSAPRIIQRPDAAHPVPPAVQAAQHAPPPVEKRHYPAEVNVIAVCFHTAGKLYDFECGDLKIEAGEAVIVETDEGLGFAQVVIAPRKESTKDLNMPLKKVIRKSTYDDMKQHQKNEERERHAFHLAQERIRNNRLPMKLVHVEYLHSGGKAIIYFSSEERVDFRNLVRDLAHEFHTRVEMRQIGPRDEAKKMGGIGICGRELCCSTWLRDFDPVSIKMAKEQELSLNPSKLAGQCGRLKCCLSYEYQAYVDAKRGMPKAGKKVCWKDGTPCGRIAGYNIFNGMMRVTLDDGTEQMVSPNDILLTRGGPGGDHHHDHAHDEAPESDAGPGVLE